MRLIDLPGKPAGELELASLDGEIESFPVFDRAEQVVVIKVGEDRVALTDLAGTHEPQVDRTLVDTREAAGVYFRLQ